MALSNIGREPRREIIESAIGIFATVGWGYVDYLIASGIHPYYVEKYGPPWCAQIALIMLLIGVGVPIILLALLHFTHAIGEEVCGWMRAVGADPRPKRRY